MDVIKKARELLKRKEEEPKTVRDIEYHYMGCIEDGDEWFQRRSQTLDVFQSLILIDGDDLKEEVKKIIKFMDDTDFKEVSDKFGFVGANEMMGARKMLMWFANLYEDDVK